MPNILDPKFKYVPAAKTDIAVTFKRIKREMAEKQKAEQERLQSIMQNVRPIGRVK